MKNTSVPVNSDWQFDQRYEKTIEVAFSADMQDMELQIPMDLSVKYGALKRPVPIDDLILRTALVR
jgi:hypothetical protein